ncbi:SLC33A1 [Symbiodinium sp. CCMP2592]|nr:SLC33A1 [Symbiodinium sp. CCMP2592]
MSWYAGKPPDWEVCWDFANRHKQGSTWNGGPYSEAVEPSPESYQPWADAQPWFPPPQPQFWPDPTWEYMQLLQMQASAARSSTMPRPVQETDSVALPPSLEKRLQELKSNKAAKPAAPPPPDREFEGSLKSLSDRHGYGFIACQDVHRIYGRDTYVPKDLVPEDIKVLDRVIFKIGLSKKGHPQVTQIRRAPIAPDSPES